jgi:hypothetical protein
MTLHESLHALGKVTASINFMIFRGPFMHDVKPGPLKKLLFWKQMPNAIPGPKEHYFADVVAGPADGCRNMLPRRGIDKRIRATDGWAACVTRGLLEPDAADMILFYLHENDHCSHRDGPQGQIDSLAAADAHIAFVLDTFGSWEETLDKVEFVVTADHSQSPISNDQDHILDLNEILADFKQVSPKRGKERFGSNDVASAGNGRVAFVYLNEGKRDALLGPVSQTLSSVPGVDQVMWRVGDSYIVDSDRGRVRFWADPSGIQDERGESWSYEGDLGAVSGMVEDGRLRTPEYPLAFWRIKGALDLDRIGDIVATMKLTYEVKDLGGGDHRGGGDHASLHVQDSIIPFMSTIGDPPLHPTTIDVAPHILRHFEE